MVDLTRRKAILGAASLATAGAGVTTAASGLDGSVEGQADVEAEQALTVTDLTTNDSGDQDAKFDRVSDDNTQFQAAVEVNNGDGVRFEATVLNNATDALDVEIQVDSPDVIDIAVSSSGSFPPAGDDIDPNDNGTTDKAIKTGEATWISEISADNSDNSDTIYIGAELDDTASPGSYDIGVAINPLSTDNTDN